MGQVWTRPQLLFVFARPQVEQGLVTREEAEECITSEFNPVRAGFHGGTEVWVRDILNIGVRPEILIAKVSPVLLPLEFATVLISELVRDVHCAGRPPLS